MKISSLLSDRRDLVDNLMHLVDVLDVNTALSSSLVLWAKLSKRLSCLRMLSSDRLVDLNDVRH